MKRKLLIIALSAVISCTVGALVACSDNTNTSQHEHSWNSGEITTPSTCGSAGVKTITCTDCGETKTESVPKTEHPHSDEWLHNDAEHWNKTTCEHTTERANVSAHVWDNGQPVREADCQHTGLIKYTCVCGMTKTQTVDKTGHSFADAWSFDSDKHWHVCSTDGCSEISGETAHNWNDGVITTPATCTSRGVKTYTCTDCGQTKTQSVPESSHIFDEEWKSDDNKHWHVCTTEGCSAIGGEEVHTYGIWTEAGQLVKICSVCSYELASPSLVSGSNETIKVGGGEAAGLTLFTRSEGYYTIQCTATVSVTFTCSYSEWDFNAQQNVRYEKTFTVTPENNSFTVKLSERSVVYITAASDSQEVVEGTVKVSYSETAPSHTHSYSTEWSTDENYHWHACTGEGCEEEQDTAMHQFEGDICTVCGYQRISEQPQA